MRFDPVINNIALKIGKKGAQYRGGEGEGDHPLAIIFSGGNIAQIQSALVYLSEEHLNCSIGTHHTKPISYIAKQNDLSDSDKFSLLQQFVEKGANPLARQQGSFGAQQYALSPEYIFALAKKIALDNNDDERYRLLSACLNELDDRSVSLAIPLAQPRIQSFQANTLLHEWGKLQNCYHKYLRTTHHLAEQTAIEPVSTVHKKDLSRIFLNRLLGKNDQELRTIFNLKLGAQVRYYQAQDKTDCSIISQHWVEKNYNLRAFNRSYPPLIAEHVQVHFAMQQDANTNGGGSCKARLFSAEKPSLLKNYPVIIQQLNASIRAILEPNTIFDCMPTELSRKVKSIIYAAQEALKAPDMDNGEMLIKNVMFLWLHDILSQPGYTLITYAETPPSASKSAASLANRLINIIKLPIGLRDNLMASLVDSLLGGYLLTTSCVNHQPLGYGHMMTTIGGAEEDTNTTPQLLFQFAKMLKHIRTEFSYAMHLLPIHPATLHQFGVTEKQSTQLLEQLKLKRHHSINNAWYPASLKLWDLRIKVEDAAKDYLQSLDSQELDKSINAAKKSQTVNSC